MNDTDLQERLFAFFLATVASTVSIDGRFRRRDEFVQIFENALYYDTQQFGSPAADRQTALCNKILDVLIEDKALLTSHDKWSGTTYQVEGANYRASINKQAQANPLCQRAKGQGMEFWKREFAAA